MNNIMTISLILFLSIIIKNLNHIVSYCSTIKRKKKMKKNYKTQYIPNS
jgi:hypothetical protein